jgi:hypothetical protein
MWNSLAGSGIKKTKSVVSQNTNILMCVLLTWLLSVIQFALLADHHFKF